MNEDCRSIIRLGLVESADWLKVRKYFSVHSPLFHATTGPRSAQIRDHGINSAGVKGIDQSGVSMSRNLDFLMRGGFGNFIFVFDARELKQRYALHPVQYSGVADEFETRVAAKRIPASYIKGFIINSNMLRFQRAELAGLPYPAVYLDRFGKWVVL